MERKLTITQARAELLTLARHLNSNPHDVVVLEHRDLEESLVLTTSRHLQRLEKLAKASRFRVGGSLKSVIRPDFDFEQFQKESRQEQARLLDAKRRRWTEESGE